MPLRQAPTTRLWWTRRGPNRPLRRKRKRL